MIISPNSSKTNLAYLHTLDEVITLPDETKLSSNDHYPVVQYQTLALTQPQPGA